MQPRAVVKLAARQSRLSSVKRWLVADEKGLFERRAEELLRSHPHANQHALALEIATLLRCEATAAMLRRAEKKTKA